MHQVQAVLKHVIKQKFDKNISTQYQRYFNKKLLIIQRITIQ